VKSIRVSSAKTEQRPYYHDFIKNDFMGHCPTMASLDYDPFPDKKLDEVVRTEIICQQLVLNAKLEGEVDDLRPGIALNFEGRSFAIAKATIQINTEGGDSKSEIEAITFLTPCEPIKVLAQLREHYSKR